MTIEEIQFLLKEARLANEHTASPHDAQLFQAMALWEIALQLAVLNQLTLEIYRDTFFREKNRHDLPHSTG